MVDMNAGQEIRDFRNQLDGIRIHIIDLLNSDLSSDEITPECERLGGEWQEITGLLKFAIVRAKKRATIDGNEATSTLCQAALKEVHENAKLFTNAMNLFWKRS